MSVNPTISPKEHRAPLTIAILVAICAALIAMPAPAGLPENGKRVIAVAILAIGLWCTEALPAGVTAMVLIIALVLTGAAPDFKDALSGFADPVAYFLLGVLTIGLAVQKSGLAERVARFFLRRSRGSARALYLQLLLSFQMVYRHQAGHWLNHYSVFPFFPLFANCGEICWCHNKKHPGYVCLTK